MYSMDTLDMSSLTGLGLATNLETDFSFSSSSDDFDVFQPPGLMEIFTDLVGIAEVKEEEEERIKEQEERMNEEEEKELCSLLPDIMTEVGIGSDSVRSSLESNQELINEVETYLQLQEQGSVHSSWSEDHLEQGSDSSWSKDHLEQGSDYSSWSKDNLEHDQTMTDRIFDALSTGNVMTDAALNQEDLQNAFTTSVTGKNGENVIIIIAPSSPRQEDSSSTYSHSPFSPSPSLSPAPSTLTSYESDLDWSPSALSTSPISSAPTRRKYQRKVRPSPPSAPYPKEKGERKKAQNRSAAFKYREKKKAEQDLVDSELLYLSNRNLVLKKKMSDMEVELKCLKKLMKETGLLP